MRIFRHGQPRWHCLRVLPQKEPQTEAWLARQGVMAFYPVTARYRRSKGKAVRTFSRYLPGYVFARFPGPVVWHVLQASPFVADAIRMNSGDLACLVESDLRRLQQMADVDEDQRQRREMAARIKPGDRVHITDGAMAGQEVEVLRLTSGGVMFQARMFGAEAIDAEAPLERVVKVG